MNAPFLNLKSPRFDLAPFRDLPSRCSVPVSGGRSSGLLAWLICEANGGVPKGAIPNFQNTSLELPETYIFLDRLDRHLGLSLLYLEHNPLEPTKVEVVGPNSLKRDSEVFERLLITPLNRRDGTIGVRPLPNPAQRTCTANLKTHTAHRYFRRHLNWPTNYHVTLGYRADEMRRVERRKKLAKKGNPEGGIGLFPLADAGITSDDVHLFWRSAPFDLGIDSNMGNCDFCFMKSEWKLKEMMLIYPDRAQRWIEYEARAATTDRPGVFRKDRPSYADMMRQVKLGNMEGSKAGDRCGTCGD